MANEDIPPTSLESEQLVEAAHLLGLSPKMPEIIINAVNPLNPDDGYVAAYIEPIRFYTLGEGGQQPHIRVGIGKLCYSPRQGPEDRERLEEVYLEGDNISLEPYAIDTTFNVYEFAMEAGRFWVKVHRPLDGISISRDDLATITFGFFIRLENPGKHLERCSDPLTEKGLNVFRETVAQFVAGHVRAIFQEDLQLWSMPRVGEVANTIFAKLDDKLKLWGMRLRKCVVAERKYPARLNELVMELRSAEQEFLNLDQIGRESLRKQWGFQLIDIAEMESISEQRGRGAGLLWIARKRKNEIGSLMEWLSSKRNPATVARDLLEDLYLVKQDRPNDIELSEQILFSAIRNPILGLGEWADTEMERSEESEYRVLEGFLQSSSGTPRVKASPSQVVT